MVKIVIFTSNEYRHLAFIDYLENSNKIKIVKIYSEKKDENNINQKNFFEKKYFKERKKYEKKYFFKKKKIIKNCDVGYISTSGCLNEIKKVKPDLIVVYGSSIIKGEILKVFKNKIINAHLGLSPYYRGSGTNIFPFINKEIQYVGVTFMYLDAGIDTGKIIHQIRPDIKLSDNIHDIGNKLIKKMFKTFKKLILNYKKIKHKKQINTTYKKYYRRKDFNEDAIKILYKNLKKGIILEYLNNRKNHKKNIKLICQDWL